MKSLLKIISILLGIFVLIISYVYADATNPTGPNFINRTLDERMSESAWPAINVEAEAGNITALTVISLSQTQTWQGYYGEISGTITLDDASNFTMYSWSMVEPQGEIYASNGSTVTWSKIRCVNYTNNGTADTNYTENITIIEDWLGLAEDDDDGIDETFNDTGRLSDGSTPHPLIYVGAYTIGAGSCPAMDTYQNDTSAGLDFVEILLTDNVSIIFTTIIENDIAGNDQNISGFDNASHDFQMIVGENGHNADTSTTNYYFFVELE